MASFTGIFKAQVGRPGEDDDGWDLVDLPAPRQSVAKGLSVFGRFDRASAQFPFKGNLQKGQPSDPVKRESHSMV